MFKHGKPFFCSADDMWQDSWSYGDWRQYICNRPNGETQCARFSTAPVFMGLASVVLVTIVVMAMMLPMGTLRPDAALVLIVVAFVLALPIIAGYFSGWYLMVPVGPLNQGAHRVCPWDEKP